MSPVQTCLRRLMFTVTLLGATTTLHAQTPASPIDHASLHSGTRQQAERDPVLRAMLEELDRNHDRLQLDGFQKPYFIEYRVEQIDNLSTEAHFGSSIGTHTLHRRLATVTVRVGDYKTDNSSPKGARGTAELATVDDDIASLRSSLWAATDAAYKIALGNYAQKLSALKQVEFPPAVDDFSHQQPVIELEPEIKPKLNPAELSSRTERISALGRSSSSFSAQSAVATFQSLSGTTRLVNTEGAILRRPHTVMQQTVYFSTQAPDGMPLTRAYESVSTEVASLDTEETLRRHATELLDTLEQLCHAPIVEEEYHGPILFSPAAAADILRAQVAPALAALRPQLGTRARTQGDYASSFHARVLPEFLSLTDDPLQTSFAGHPLVGAYTVDDEGVPAQAVSLVEKGKLTAYLIGRQPVRDFLQSNGHGQAALTGPAMPSASVLTLSSSGSDHPLSPEELQARLAEMARDRDLPGVYYVESMGPGMRPRVLYRVTQDGKRQLVRGAVIDELDRRSIRSGIIAAGKDTTAFNFSTGGAISVITPSLLFDELSIKRAEDTLPRLPYYPPPASTLGENPAAPSEP